MSESEELFISSLNYDFSTLNLNKPEPLIFNNVDYWRDYDNSKDVKITTTVVNKYKSPFEVYIGRGSKWGNPFIIGKDGTREEVINKYKEWILKQPILLEQLHELKGKILGCFCKPLACHGDVLVEMIEKLENGN